MLSRDPGGTPLGEKVREILLDPANHSIDVVTEAFLHLASRSQAVSEVIRPALEAGKIVISERFQTSTEVYQGVAGGLSVEELGRMGKLACGGISPDVLIILDVDAEVGLGRLGCELDRMERKGKEFHRKIRQGFLEAAERDASIKVINAERPIQEVAEEIRKIVSGVI
jgi:dTMP kinase